ncbi:glycoside hydrolase family 36 protein [Paenibacillus sacheonensis]|uniref:Alpha-galactosidase n=1 Tax=Paenibacillus sacheonensis TaxID=742054 RepID=A0A7X4YSQ9_9BACL|nr:alpha-galactosidase [Paenibacillus sacheonensis]MBM7567216.1 alpha-galactosidase [Paenibacillus sacheonensis]NBC70859.1 hypothetical protein [Paenibacillus sacheonensis]
MVQTLSEIIGGKAFTFKCEDDIELAAESREEGGIRYIMLRMQSDTPKLPAFSAEWVQAFNDIQARFTGHYWADRYIIPNWYGGMNMAPHNGSPVYALYSAGGENRVTVSVSDTRTRTHMVADIEEGASTMPFTVKLMPEPGYETTDYRIELRIDERPVPIYESLRDLSDWWSEQEGCRPLPAPDAARLPCYSTWYAYHHRIDAEKLVHEAKLARELGCGTVILDFGWQIDRPGETDPAFGQWEIAADKFPDMASTVRTIQALGLKIMVWFSVPHINRSNPLYEQFSGFVLDPDEDQPQALDPRYPAVRDYLVGRYVRALEEWNIDGFKLDFVDHFSRYLDFADRKSRLRSDPAHDTPSLDLAVDKLLSAITSRLTALKPDIMLEFRQNYTGPRMRAYGNIFRAMDCALGSHTNRFRTADIRMLAGDSVVHSDMFAWHPDESPESAAQQFIGVLHAVPQISVRLAELSEPHARMLKFYTAFWLEHRDALQFGRFMPESPENLYPAITCQTPDKQVTTAYNRIVVKVAEEARTLVLVNGSHDAYVAADFGDEAQWDILVQNCMGDVVASEVRTLSGVASIAVPRSGVVTAVRQAGG